MKQQQKPPRRPNDQHFKGYYQASCLRLGLIWSLWRKVMRGETHTWRYLHLCVKSVCFSDVGVYLHLEQGRGHRRHMSRREAWIDELEAAPFVIRSLGTDGDTKREQSVCWTVDLTKQRPWVLGNCYGPLHHCLTFNRRNNYKSTDYMKTVLSFKTVIQLQ